MNSTNKQYSVTEIWEWITEEEIRDYLLDICEDVIDLRRRINSKEVGILGRKVDVFLLENGNIELSDYWWKIILEELMETNGEITKLVLKNGKDSKYIL